MENLALRIQKLTSKIKKSLKIAVMGCVVNGIGEGKSADFGVAGGKKKSIIFAKGDILKTVPNEEIESALIGLIEEYADE